MNRLIQNTLVAAAREASDFLAPLSPLDGARAAEIKKKLDQALKQVAEEAEAKKDAAADFDGATYDPAKDKKRLRRQLGKVFEAMRDGQWKTLPRLAGIVCRSEASISARIRDLRKPKFGSYVVERRRLGRAESGLFEYRLLSADGKPISKDDVVETTIA